jgi:hypothetical protein
MCVCVTMRSENERAEERKTRVCSLQHTKESISKTLLLERNGKEWH